MKTIAILRGSDFGTVEYNSADDMIAGPDFDLYQYGYTHHFRNIFIAEDGKATATLEAHTAILLDVISSLASRNEAVL